MKEINVKAMYWSLKTMRITLRVILMFLGFLWLLEHWLMKGMI